MRRLDPLIQAALDRPLTAVWLSRADVEALGAGELERSAVLLGRLLRTGALQKSERGAIGEWLGESFTAEDAQLTITRAAALLDQVRSLGTSGFPTTTIVAARDDAESIVWALGAGALASGSEVLVSAERRSLASAVEVDEAVLARRDEWLSGAHQLDSRCVEWAWLCRMADLDATSWWLDLVSLCNLRGRLAGAQLLATFRAPAAATPLRLRRSANAPRADLRVYAEVVGCEDDPARVAAERGSIVARLFDGEVEVLVVGLRNDTADLPAALCVRRSGGGTEAIARVELRGEPAGSSGMSAAGFWTPLPPDGTRSCELVVEMQGREETLVIELSD